MSFTSGSFLYFFGALLLCYYLVPKRFRWMLLLAGSLLFYGLAGDHYLPFMLFTALSVYLGGLLLGRLHDRQRTESREEKRDKEQRKLLNKKWNRKRNRIFIPVLLLNLGLLGALKYTNALLGSFALGKTDWVLPLGISFYTFQAIGYLIDVKRGKYPPEKNFARFALFISFFPQLIQGPISRYDQLSKTLYSGASFDLEAVGMGLVRVLWGYIKKLVVADRLTGAVSLLFSSVGLRGEGVFLGMLLYALRLYGDFTGGIDIAIGCGEMLGVRLPENFNRPYFSKNIEEYWTRWHITMGSWFRDYVFYPLTVSKLSLRLTGKARKRFKNGLISRLPLYGCTLLVWLATGIWHGAGWNFALWGLTNGAVLVFSQELKPLYARFHSRFPGLKEKPLYGVFEILRTFLLLCLIRLWDCFTAPLKTLQAFAALFTDFSFSRLIESFSTLGLAAFDWSVLLFMSAALVLLGMEQKKGPIRERLFKGKPLALWGGAALLLVLTLLLGVYGFGYTAADFIYGKF